jgi:hypothetical protein
MSRIYRMYDAAPRSIYAPHRVNDTLLSVPTQQEWDEYFAKRAKLDDGMVWNGLLKPTLDAMEPEQRKKMFMRLDSYRRDAGLSASELPGWAKNVGRVSDALAGANEIRADRDPRTPGSNAARAATMNDANRKRWGRS